MFSQEAQILMFLFFILFFIIFLVFSERNFFLSLSAETAMSKIAVLGQGVIQI